MTMYTIDGFPDYMMRDDCTVWRDGEQVRPYFNYHRGLLIDLFYESGQLQTVRMVELINEVFPPRWRR